MSDAMTRMEWEQRYSDDSGVELGVCFERKNASDAGTIKIIAIDTIEIPAAKARWLLDKLDNIVLTQGL